MHPQAKIQLILASISEYQRNEAMFSQPKSWLQFPVRLLVAIGILFSSCISSSQTRGSFERAGEPPLCSLRQCLYFPVNRISDFEIETLIRAVEIQVFGDKIVPGDTYIQRNPGSRNNQIVYWDQNPAIRQQIAEALINQDRIPTHSFRRQPRIEVGITILALDQSATKSFQFSLDIARRVQGAASLGVTDRLGVDSSNGPTSLNWNGGNLQSSLYGLALDFSRIKNWSRENREYGFSAAHGELLRNSKSTLTYLNPNALSDTRSERSGFQADGRAFISQDPQTFEPSILVKDLKVTWGVPTRDNEKTLVQSIEINPTDIEVRPGSTVVLWEDNVNLVKTQRVDQFVFAQGSARDTVEARLYILATFSILAPSGNEPIIENAGFTSDQISTLDQGDAKSVERLAESLTARVVPTSLVDAFGQKVLLQLGGPLTQASFPQNFIVEVERLRDVSKLNEKSSGESVQEPFKVMGADLFTKARPIEIDPQKICKSKEECGSLDYLIRLKIAKSLDFPELNGQSAVYHVRHQPESFYVSKPKFLGWLGRKKAGSSWKFW